MYNELKQAQNIKMLGSRIVMCPEIEGIEPCKFFGKDICEDCYAERLHPVRKLSWKGKSKTPSKGIIRLGTWREITLEDYIKFKELFPDRHFFLITRGLENYSFYKTVCKDPYCINIQVSVDIKKNENSVSNPLPGYGRLLAMNTLSKTIFRFKTTDDTVTTFEEIRAFLRPKTPPLETPLRKRGAKKIEKKTPIEKTPILKHRYLKCAGKCESCHETNGINVCLTDLR